MKDIILHIPNLKEFREQGMSLSQTSDIFNFNDGNLVYNIDKVPVKYLGNESICLVRGLDSDLEEITTAVKLGECVGGKGSERYEFTSEENRLTYERVRGPLDYSYKIDEETITGKHPYMIGVFA